MSRTHDRIRRLGVALAASTVLAASPALAQVPETFTNLQVLPPSTSRASLLTTMRGFSEGLGVRCDHCHSGPAGASPAALTFAADDKGAKQTAREMMRMVETINRDLLSNAVRPAQVTCLTCHRGLPQVRTLARVVSEAAEKGGAGEAVGLYRRLRAEHYGSGRYDFTERSLAAAAEAVLARGDAAGAASLLELNLEFFPDSALTYFFLGESQRQAGALDKARASYERSLKLDPTNPLAKARLEQLPKPR